MKNVIIQELIDEINSNGYVIVEDFISETESKSIQKEMKGFNNTFYTENGLMETLCYKREESQNRQGDAFMVSGKLNSDLPSYVLPNCNVRELFWFYQNIVMNLVGEPMSNSSRAMLNCQQYFGKSLPVFDHYDGLFMDFVHGDKDKYGEKTFVLNKGLIPRYVMVVVLYNENDGGTYVRMHDSEDRIDVPNKSHSLIIFDNLKMRHGVPKLDKPRMMIGFRNFDYHPYYFEKNPENKKGFVEMPDAINPGWVKDIDELESIELQQQFIKKWKSGLAIDVLEKDPAF